MAIKIQGTDVISDNRELSNIKFGSDEITFPSAAGSQNDYLGLGANNTLEFITPPYTQDANTVSFTKDLDVTGQTIFADANNNLTIKTTGQGRITLDGFLTVKGQSVFELASGLNYPSFTHTAQFKNTGGSTAALLLSGTGTGLAFINNNGQFVLRSGSNELVTANSTLFDVKTNIAASNLNIANWDTAYGWGNHADAGYLTSETDSQTLSWTGANTTLSISNGNSVNLSSLLDDTNTTYNLLSPGTTGVLRLQDSANSNDDIRFIGSGATSVTSNSTHIIISSTDTNTDTNTTYDLLAVANTAANAGLLRLKDSSNANDTVTFTGSGATTVSSNATHVIISSTDTGILNVVEDTTPQLGGNLDTNGKDIFAPSINQSGPFTTTGTSLQISAGDAVNGSIAGQAVGGNIVITPGSATAASSNAINGYVAIDGLIYPGTDGTAGQALITDGSGKLSFGTVTATIDYANFGDNLGNAIYGNDVVTTNSYDYIVHTSAGTTAKLDPTDAVAGLLYIREAVDATQNADYNLVMIQTEAGASATGGSTTGRATVVDSGGLTFNPNTNVVRTSGSFSATDAVAARQFVGSVVNGDVSVAPNGTGSLRILKDTSMLMPVIQMGMGGGGAWFQANNDMGIISHYGTSANTAATAVSSGTEYMILSQGTSDFTTVGAASNNAGTIFTATGTPTGDGVTVATSSLKKAFFGMDASDAEFKYYVDATATFDSGTFTDRAVSGTLGYMRAAGYKTDGTTGFLRSDGTVDTSTYLTGYTESDTLATVTGRGATTATAISITNTTGSSSKTTGALVVSGGVGVNGSVYADAGNFNGISVSNQQITRSNGYLQLIGGGPQNSRNFLMLTNSGGTILHGGSASTDGPLDLPGSAYGILLDAGDGFVTIPKTTASSNTSTGALIVGGGVGVGADVRSGGHGEFVTLSVGRSDISEAGGSGSVAHIAGGDLRIDTTKALRWDGTNPTYIKGASGTSGYIELNPGNSGVALKVFKNSGNGSTAGYISKIQLGTGASSNTESISVIEGYQTIWIDPLPGGGNVGGTVVIKGNLQVDGTTTTLNSTTLTVDDLNIVVASGAADSAAADGAGFTVDGASKSITWSHANQYFTANSKFEADGYVVSGQTGFLKADGTIDTSTYLTGYTESDTLASVTTRGNTTTNAITVGGITTSGVIQGVENASGTGKNITVKAGGYSAAGDGGSTYIYGGDSTGSAGNGGDVLIQGGLPTTGSGGDISILAAGATSGRGGGVTIRGGGSSGYDGGDVQIYGGLSNTNTRFGGNILIGAGGTASTSTIAGGYVKISSGYNSSVGSVEDAIRFDVYDSIGTPKPNAVVIKNSGLLEANNGIGVVDSIDYYSQDRTKTMTQNFTNDGVMSWIEANTNIISFTSNAGFDLGDNNGDAATLRINSNATNSGLIALGVPGEISYLSIAPSDSQGTNDVNLKMPPNTGSAGQVMTTDGSGNLSFTTITDTNTTYDLLSPGTTGVLRLKNSSNSNDDIRFIGSGATSVTSNSTHIIISSTDTNTDTNTTYDLLAVANTAANAGLLRLKNSSNANDNVTFSGSGATTVSSNATHIIISSTDTNTDTNTTYNLLSPGTGVLRLQDSANSNDNITFVGSGATSVTSNATHIIISSTDTNTDTNTTYNLLSPGSGVLRLQDSANSNDNITFVGSGATSVTSNSTHVIISSTDTNTNTDTLQSIAANSTNANNYVTFVGSASGAQTGRSDTGLLYNPSTNNLYVGGTLFATSKSFDIKHPTRENYRLRYGSLEGPENGVYVRGRLKGENIINLPDYWRELVDEDSITVQLTPIGKHQKLYVSDIQDNMIIIERGEWLTNDINCFYLVQAERKDISKIAVEYPEHKGE